MRILKWSNNQLLARLKIVHEILDKAVKANNELAHKLRMCQEWTTEREALVKTPTIEEIAKVEQGRIRT